MFIEAVDPGGIPTFREGLGASWELLVTLALLLVLVAGALLPFLWVPLVMWLLWRLMRSRRWGLAPAGGASAATPEPPTPRDA